jgi:hypothetical protein
MAGLVFNVALGRGIELARAVDVGSPANSRLIVVVINNGGTSDATMKDYDTLALLLADAGVAEVTNSGYARKTLAAADVTLTLDDTGNTYAFTFSAQTWTTVAAGDAWTDLVVCYDPDNTAGTDADLIPIALDDCVATPAGGDITYTPNASGFFRAS